MTCGDYSTPLVPSGFPPGESTRMSRLTPRARGVCARRIERLETQYPHWPLGTIETVRCVVLLVLPCRSRTCSEITIGTTPSEVGEPPDRKSHVVPGVN